MLGKIVKDKERERQEYHNKLVEYHNSELVKMEKLKAELEKLGDGYLKLKIKFGDITREDIAKSHYPCLDVTNIMGAVSIRGTIDELIVSGLGIFHLMGEKHSVESFFKKIAPYLRY
jgi:hypothetical protein